MRRLSRAPYKRTLFGDTLLVGALTAIARALGLVKTIVMATVAGPGALLDSWLLAFLVPSFASDVFLAAIAPALVPRIADLRYRGCASEARRLYAEVFSRAVRLSTIAAAFVAAGALVAPHIASDAETRLVSNALLWMAPIFVFNGCSNVWRSVLLVESRFAVIAVAPCLSPVAITLCLVQFKAHVVSGLAFGAMAGSLAEAALLAVAVSKAGAEPFPSRPGGPGFTDSLYSHYGFLVAGNLAVSGAAAIDQCIAAFSGQGGLSQYNFGTRFPNVLLSTGPAALGATTLPRLARTAAANGSSSIRAELARVLWISGGLATVCSLALFFCSPLIVQLTMQHGAFTARDAVTVAQVQSWSLLQLPFAVCIAAVSRALACSGDTRMMARVALAAAIFTPILDFAFLPRLGVAGIALARTFILAITMGALSFAAFRSKPSVLAAVGAP
jgi:putative peptidoglycan lipid II flippase